jgi:hypothetical protein
MLFLVSILGGATKQDVISVNESNIKINVKNFNGLFNSINNFLLRFPHDT